MSFIQNMYEYKKVFRDIEKLSKKCVHLKYDIEYIYIFNVIYQCHIYIQCQCQLHYLLTRKD